MNILKVLFDRTHFTIFFLIIWDALKYYLGLESPIYQVSILLPILLIGISDNIKKKSFWHILSNKPGSIWLLWICFALFNTFFITGFYHPGNQSPFVFISAILISYLFFVLIVSKNTDTEKLIVVMQLAFAVRLILSYIFDSSSIQGTDTVARFGAEFNANAIAFGALFYLVLMGIKKIQYRKIHFIEHLFAFVAVGTILLTASKKNFLTLIFVIIGYIIIIRSKNIMKNLVLGSISLSLVGIGVIWSLNNTDTGKRILHTYDKTINAESTDKMLDHRTTYYTDGWELFKDNSLNGIGLMNFPYRNNSTHVLHTEYMVQLTENGIIGSILFILFYGHIINALIKIRKTNLEKKKQAEIYLLALSVMFILFFGSWIYNNPLMWVLIALAVRFIRENKTYKSQIVPSIERYQ